MSVSSADSALRQIESQIERLKKQQSEADDKVSRLGEQISAKEGEVEKATNPSTKRTKQSQLKTLKDKRDRARRDSSEAGKKLAALEPKKHRAEAKLREERQKENDKETQQLQRTIGDLTDQLAERAALREPNMIMSCVRPLIEQYPDALPLFDSAAEKYEQGNADRNALDDIRLCFEKVLQALFSNGRSLENQVPAICGLLKGADVSAEFRNLLNKAIDYYTKYQNNHVKHDDSINPHEVNFVIEFSCILMKQMIEQFGQGADDLDDEADEIDDINLDQAEIDR